MLTGKEVVGVTNLIRVSSLRANLVKLLGEHNCRVSFDGLKGTN